MIWEQASSIAVSAGVVGFIVGAALFDWRANIWRRKYDDLLSVYMALARAAEHASKTGPFVFDDKP